MRWLTLLVLLLLVPPAAAQPPRPTTLEPVLTVSVRLDLLLAAGPFQGLRAAVETDTPLFTAETERDYTAKPLEFTRLTYVRFVSVPAREYPLELPVVVRTLRRPVDVAAFTAAIDGQQEAVPGRPDMRLIRGRTGTHGVAGDQIVTFESRSIARPPVPLCERLFGIALKKDAEAAKEPAVAIARWDGRAAKRAMSEPEQGELPPPLRTLFAADDGVLTVRLRPGGTVRGVSQMPALIVRAAGTFPDEAAATTAVPAAKEMLTTADGLLKVARLQAAQNTVNVWPPLFDLAEAALKSVNVSVDGKTAAVDAVAELTPAVTAALAGLPRQADEASGRIRSGNNLKQIGLAFHNHESISNHLPDNIYSKDGRPLLSWRVAVLPYLDEEKLYAEFRLDEPWDSDHNRKLLPRMPKVYALPGAKAEPGRTFYQSFIGKKGMAPTALFVEGGRKRTFSSITDGTSNTLMAVEAAEAVEWTKPADLPFAPDGPLPKLGGHFGKGFHAVYCDGSVRMLPADLPPTKLRALITADGGEVVDLP